MLNRRQFLLGSTVASSFLLGACNDQSSDLSISLLQGSLPLQLISNISQQSDQLKNVKLETKLNPSELYNLLLTEQGKKPLEPENQSFFKFPKFGNKSSVKKKDIVAVGNYWLKQAIEEDLIESLEITKLANWQKLTPFFQQLVSRNNQGNLNPEGKIWGAPYRWGCTMIAYRNDKFKDLGWQPTDWQDLWNEDIKQRFSLLNQPREIIGLTLKKLGYSYNHNNPRSIDNLLPQLKKLNQQVKFYNSKNYLQPLILGDTWLAVGWSSDILPVVSRYSNISAIVPNSGTSLWADIWVKPKSTEDTISDLDKLYQWIDFCWQEKSVKQINLFTKAMSTIEVANNLSSKKNYSLTMDTLKQSEFIEQLPAESLTEYENMWRELFST